MFLANCKEQKETVIPKATVVTAPQPPKEYKILVVNNNLRKENSQRTIKTFVANLKAIYPAHYDVVHWSEFSEQILGELKPDLIILSPQSNPWQNYPRKDFDRFIVELKNTKLPMIGICGGHQLIALFRGGKLKPIEPKGSKCQYPKSYDNCKREKGLMEVVLTDDPVFAGLKGTARVWLNHVEEVSQIPEGFVIIAHNQVTNVQAMKDTTGRFYGFQFHPERADSLHPDGAIILRNAINLVLNKQL